MGLFIFGVKSFDKQRQHSNSDKILSFYSCQMKKEKHKDDVVRINKDLVTNGGCVSKYIFLHSIYQSTMSRWKLPESHSDNTHPTPFLEWLDVWFLYIYVSIYI